MAMEGLGEGSEGASSFVESIANVWPAFGEIETWGLLGLIGVGFGLVGLLEQVARRKAVRMKSQASESLQLC